MIQRPRRVDGGGHVPAVGTAAVPDDGAVAPAQGNSPLTLCLARRWQVRDANTRRRATRGDRVSAVQPGGARRTRTAWLVQRCPRRRATRKDGRGRREEHRENQTAERATAHWSPSPLTEFPVPSAHAETVNARAMRGTGHGLVRSRIARTSVFRTTVASDVGWRPRPGERSRIARPHDRNAASHIRIGTCWHVELARDTLGRHHTSWQAITAAWDGLEPVRSAVAAPNWLAGEVRCASELALLACGAGDGRCDAFGVRRRGVGRRGSAASDDERQDAPDGVRRFLRAGHAPCESIGRATDHMRGDLRSVNDSARRCPKIPYSLAIPAPSQGSIPVGDRRRLAAPQPRIASRCAGGAAALSHQGMCCTRKAGKMTSIPRGTFGRDWG